MSLSPGQMLMHYRLVERIGEGGMGEVWRAADTTLGRDVAIKVLPAAFAADPERMARFEREAKVLASLNHPQIAAIYGQHQADGVRFLAMELVAGEDLSQRLARGAIPLDEALPMARRIAEALEYAHDQGIVHRDLKPANVKVTPDGGVKVLDFGLAKAIAGEAALRDVSSTPTVLPTMTSTGTMAGIILGTAAYMSPEQARGKAVDKRTDIWAFGCVLYECLAGRQLFEGETVSDLIAKILQTEPDWSGLPAATPPRIRTLLARCLQKDPKERLRDAGEARIALASPGEAAAPSVESASRSRGAPWWAAVAGALVLAVAAVAATVTLRPAARSAPLRKLDVTTGNIAAGFASAPRISPDGGAIAYLAKNRIWVRELAELEPRPVADVQSSTPVDWAPDSGSLVFTDLRKLLVVPRAGGRPNALCEIPGTGQIIGVTWNRSGQIAFSVWRGGLYPVAAAGGKPELMLENDPATTVDFHSPSWLPNGELMYLTHWTTEADGSGKPRPALSFLDGRRQIPLDGDLDDERADASVMVAPTGELLMLRQGTNPGVWSMGFDASNHRVVGTPRLVAPDAASMSVSDEGSLLYVARSGTEESREPVWVDRAGKVIETAGPAHTGMRDVTLSPDGRRLAFSARDGEDHDVWVRDLTRGTETRLTFGKERNTSPAWIGSSRIAYVQGKNVEGRILVVNADGSGGQGELAPTVTLGLADENLDVAADGTRAVRIVSEGGHGRLRVGSILANGTLGPLKPLLTLQPEPDVQSAAISPDGKLLAYVRNDPGQTVELFVTRFPSGVGQWQVGTEGGRTPRWARDSKELFFVAGSGPSTRAMASVRVDPSMDPPIGEVSRLFVLSGEGELNMSDSERFDVTADGRRFLFLRKGRSGGEDRVVLVQNWRAEFAKDARR